jgi:outer membrane protein TolC
MMGYVSALIYFSKKFQSGAVVSRRRGFCAISTAYKRLGAAVIYIYIILIMENLVLTAHAYGTAEGLKLNLGLAYDLAISNDAALKAAGSDAVIANEELRQAHRSRGVTVTVEHDTVRTEDYVGGGIDYNLFTNAIKATYPLYTGGLTEASIASAVNELESKKRIFERARLDLKLSVATMFFTMLRMEDMANLAREAEDRLAAHLRNVNIQYENGKVGKADLLRSEVELINIRQQRSQATNEYMTAVKNLNDIMGLPLDTELINDERMPYEKFDHTLDECVRLALSNNLNIEIADLLREKAKDGVRIAQSDKRPKVSMYAAYTLSDLSKSGAKWPGLEGGNEDNLRIGIHAEYTLLDSGVSASRIIGARENVRKAELNREKTYDDVLLSVTRDFMEMDEARVRIETSLVGLDKAREAYRIALVSYREGIGTNTDVLDAQAALSQANSNYTQALCDYNIAIAKIENSMGASIPD